MERTVTEVSPASLDLLAHLSQVPRTPVRLSVPSLSFGDHMPTSRHFNIVGIYAIDPHTILFEYNISYIAIDMSDLMEWTYLVVM